MTELERAGAQDVPSIYDECDRCHLWTWVLVEPDDLWTRERGRRLCPPCARRTAHSKPDNGAGTIPLNLT